MLIIELELKEPSSTVSRYFTRLNYEHHLGKVLVERHARLFTRNNHIQIASIDDLQFGARIVRPADNVAYAFK